MGGVGMTGDNLKNLLRLMIALFGLGFYLTARPTQEAQTSQQQDRKQEIHKAIAAGDLGKIQALLAADPGLLEFRDENGCTPLLNACLSSKTTIAHFLLDRGAEVKVQSSFKQTPLHRACNGPIRDYELIKRLLDKGADVKGRNGYDFTPLYGAAMWGDFKVARLLVERGAEVNAQNDNGITPLHRAAQAGSLDITRLLLDGGADPNAYDHFKGKALESDISGTILQVAINNGENEAVGELLIARGAKLNHRDPQGNSELHLAAMKGYSQLVQTMLKHGADVEAVNNTGRTALYYAAKHGYRRAAEALLAGGAKKETQVEANYGPAPQLTAALKQGEAHLWLSDYSYAVKTQNNFLVFTLQNIISQAAEAGLANGYLNPPELAGQAITLFLNHRNVYQMGAKDFSKLAQMTPDVRVVSSFKPDYSQEENPEIPAYRLALPHEGFTEGGIKGQSIPALNGGLGYLVEVDGLKIFHAGLHISSNEATIVAKFRQEIDYLKPFGPIDIAVLAVWDHADLADPAYEPYLYLIDQLAPRAVFLRAANSPEQYRNCAEVLKVRGIPVFYPEGSGDRFHYLRRQEQK